MFRLRKADWVAKGVGMRRAGLRRMIFALEEHILIGIESDENCNIDHTKR